MREFVEALKKSHTLEFRGEDGMREKSRTMGRFAVWCFLVVCLVFSTIAPALADMGEKPSVTLKIINAPPGPYAAALFVKGEPHKEEEYR